ncbi:hypothetical protein H696_04567 [Fonticula alba]|uniref:Uncharacterized protein n=1 Tax=Fonticula alba TaxID=691883 RepID=A0A058Z5D2_FONAL|nr:hypothetical protein H696_04567 [Fonticula alba]KCV69153.1 hypothetical protein H696_04567 [Fonticula alba]|eukprot:XP_009496724.1 hypothetical protein H696_04567 [Fonticula alba]
MLLLPLSPSSWAVSSAPCTTTRPRMSSRLASWRAISFPMPSSLPTAGCAPPSSVP